MFWFGTCEVHGDLCPLCLTTQVSIIRFGAGVKTNKRLKDIGAVGPIQSLAGRTRACYITQYPTSQNCLVRLFVENQYY